MPDQDGKPRIVEGHLRLDASAEELFGQEPEVSEGSTVMVAVPMMLSGSDKVALVIVGEAKIMRGVKLAGELALPQE